jgi:hypothetical protein
MNKKQLKHVEDIKRLAEVIYPETAIQKEIANMIIYLANEIKVEEIRKNI